MFGFMISWNMNLNTIFFKKISKRRKLFLFCLVHKLNFLWAYLIYLPHPLDPKKQILIGCIFLFYDFFSFEKKTIHHIFFFFYQKETHFLPIFSGAFRLTERMQVSKTCFKPLCVNEEHSRIC